MGIVFAGHHVSIWCPCFLIIEIIQIVKDILFKLSDKT